MYIRKNAKPLEIRIYFMYYAHFYHTPLFHYFLGKFLSQALCTYLIFAKIRQGYKKVIQCFTSMQYAKLLLSIVYLILLPFLGKENAANT